MLFISALITFIVILTVGAAIGYVAQYRWIRQQRGRYQVLHAKKLGGNITPSELEWLNAAEEHKYRSFFAYLDCKYRSVKRDVRRFHNDFENALKDLKSKQKRVQKKAEKMTVVTGVHRPSGATVVSKVKDNTRLLDTAKLREDAVCFDRGYMGVGEAEMMGKLCDDPFTAGSRKTEAELKAEEHIQEQALKEKIREAQDTARDTILAVNKQNNEKSNKDRGD